jgi:glycosyltransferase involved in cell wall biosynthesis
MMDARAGRPAMPAPSLADLPPPPRNREGWPWTVGSPAAPERTPDGGPWPRISIVTASFQQGSFIEEAIRSVLLQRYPELEYIVLDGGSTDRTPDVLREYEPWLSFCRVAPDRGQVAALNEGFARATGEWRAWLNSDDLYEPGVLHQVGAAAPSSSWVVGRTGYVDEHSSPIGSFPTAYRARPFASEPAWVDVLCARASGTALPQQSSFWRRAAQAAAGDLDESLELTFDHEFWVRLAHAGFEPTLVDAQFARYRRHREQKTRPLTRAASYREEARVTRRWLARCPDEHRAAIVSYRRACARRAWFEAGRGTASRVAPAFLRPARRVATTPEAGRR